MPGKSRHGKGKHHQHRKKTGAKQRYGAVALQQPAVTGTPQPAATISTPPPSRAPAPTTTRTAQYPYITTELRNIGILSGIILVILIVLALVLS